MANGRQIGRWGFLAVIALTGTAVADAPATATQAAAIDAGRWEAVVRGFQSEKIADREAAQKILDAATWRDAPALRALAEKATHAEVKARLENRLQAIALDGLVHPPPISLDVKDAGINELAAALTAATGADWEAWDRGPSSGSWNLTAHERPLWEVFRSLEKQSSVHVQNSGSKVVLAPGPMIPGGLGPIDGDWTDVVAGDFLIYVGIGRGLGPVGLHAAGAPAVPTVKLEYGVRGDPRMRLIRCGIPDILSVVDENGKVLHAAQPRSTPNWMPATGSMAEVNTAMGFDEVAGMGKLLTIKGQMVVRRATAIERVEIAGLTSQASAPVVAGGRTWQMWAVPPMGQNGWIINVTEQGAALALVPLSVKVVDAAGKIVWDGVVDQRTSTRVQPGDVRLPLKAIILAAKGTKDEVVPFEIKEVPVPAPK